MIRGEPQDCLGRLEREFAAPIERCRDQQRFISTAESFLHLRASSVPELAELEHLIMEQRQLHELHLEVNNASLALHSCLWSKLDTDYQLQRFRELAQSSASFSASLLTSDGPAACFKTIADTIAVLPLLDRLTSPNMRRRHWSAIQQHSGVYFKVDDVLLVGTVLMCELLKNASFVEDVVESARHEENIEQGIR